MGNREAVIRPETAHCAVLGWLKEASVRGGPAWRRGSDPAMASDIATRYEVREILKLRSRAAAGF
jgi:hypothetical protein